MTDTHDRVALITGASGGLGSIVLPMFLDAGYRCAAVALDWPEHPAERDDLLTLTADLQDATNAEDVVRKTLDHFGRLDCLVHLVGVFAKSGPLEATSDDVWHQMLDGNLTAAFHMIRAVIGPMRSSGGGRIAIVGSTVAVQPVVTWGAFSVAMGGLSALVQVAAAELRHEHITVNLLHPSTIDTPQVRAGHDPEEAALWVNPRGMGSLLLWLCGDEGGDVSGSAIVLPARQPHPAYDWPGLTNAGKK